MLTVTRKSQLALQSPIRLVCTRLQHCSSVPRWTRWSRWLTPFLRIFSRALYNIDLCPLTLLALLERSRSDGTSPEWPSAPLRAGTFVR